MTREQKLDLIYRHTHAGFKGVASAETTPTWPEEMLGRRTLLVVRGGWPMMVILESLTDEDIEHRLEYALGRETAA